MSTLNGISSGEVVALGWTLLHFCWQSTAIAIGYAVIDRCTARAAATVRYSIALTALALMPLVAIATFFEQEQLVSHATQSEQHFAVSQLGTMHAALMQQLPVAAPAVGTSELWIAEHASLLLPWMDALWLAGVLVFALRAAGGWLELRGLRMRAQAKVPQHLRDSFDRLSVQFRLSRRVVLRVSDEVVSPMVFGIWRTIVLFPLSAAMSLPVDQLEAVLAHELAHVGRWDYFCNLLQTLVECLFFFQPAMWWVSRRTRDFREVCCDEVAARGCADPVVYAEALLKLEEQRAQHLQLAVALHGDGGTLLNRVRRIMGEKAMEQKSMSGIRMAAVTVVLLGLYVAPHVAHGLKSERNHADQLVATGNTDTAPSVVAVATVANPGPVAMAMAAPQPSPVPAPQPASQPSALPAPEPAPDPNPQPSADAAPQGSGLQYIQRMREAGYPLDLDKDLNQIVTLRSVGVTPEYAKSMAQVGLGTPSLHDLVTLKSVGITPEYVASLKDSVLAPASFHDAVTIKSLGLTPEYARSLESLGLGRPTMHDVVSMKSVGVTPEYVAALKSSGIAPADLHEAVSMKAVGVTPEYASSMAAAGFSGMNAHELISMRAQGMTPEYAKWLKSTFPGADSHAMRQATVFHIDADFIAKAKANGFNSASLEKLTKLKMSGLLN
ncbi:M56 family metallopeptidase [Terriglobus roseus]|uniref:Signal transducer regulating beta-lactamase production, contains metallopeptidase domain n=1 Tax=Terriglobus roseus TaxID=392734 RepID=A0A1H4JR15_9BACT|nr:M56 family metallopeptidase [Terriglobus roseus]SEB48567.1 Signal transducer regulating beta-lactamase production, contains metallopeptidase domain [Terriglobus roseus]